MVDGIADFASRVLGMIHVAPWSGPGASYALTGVPRRGVRGAHRGACGVAASFFGFGAGVAESASNQQMDILPKRHAQA